MVQINITLSETVQIALTKLRLIKGFKLALESYRSQTGNT